MAFDAVSQDSTTIFFARISGSPTPPNRVVTDISRPGLNGVGFRIDGIKPKVYELVGVTHAANKIAAEQLLSTLASWTGGFCTVRIADYLWTNQILLATDTTSVRQAQAVCGGPYPNSKWVIETKMTFQFGGPIVE